MRAWCYTFCTECVITLEILRGNIPRVVVLKCFVTGFSRHGTGSAATTRNDTNLGSDQDVHRRTHTLSTTVHGTH